MLKPTTAAEIQSIVQSASATRTPLDIIGHGSKRRIGRPVEEAETLDLSQLSGINFYEPDELVLSAKAGTPLAEIEKLLAKHGQELAFEPMDYAPLFGGKAGKGGKSGTIGGVLATNTSGPRRLRAGAARDHILGIEAVTGRGDLFKSGGRVVKNVTGYDLSKGLAGSWGTLAVIIDVIFKVLPAAETETTLVIGGLEDDAAALAMATAMGSSAEVSSAAHLPYTVSATVVGGAIKGASATCIRIEGFPRSVEARVAQLAKLIGRKTELLPDKQSRSLWVQIRDCIPFADGSQTPVWRVSVAPMAGHALVADLRLHAAVDAYYDWQGGLVWLKIEGEPEADAIRALVKKHGGGHATLVRANDEQRRTIPVFEPQPPALAALSMRIKEQFDPAGILNPGRMG
ncbi:MAG: glycolate oxidase subunit GlcE [Rhizobiaceae bacterium]